ncbi:HD domain-containing protein [Pseudomonas aeruginosa]|uniref:HD domain-containing protein n=1 Tax=Pseudomonas aeruginosa TaxID=287 RepID=UPI003D2DB39B
MISKLWVKLASLFAVFAHESIRHKRRYTHEPYWHHLREVAELVELGGGDYQMVMAAWLHDTLEDTWVKPWMIKGLFGQRVCDLVIGMTQVSKPGDGNRAVRKEIDRQFLAKQSPCVKTIKLADLIANLPSIVQHDERFAKVYVQEVRALLKVLTEGDQVLQTLLIRHLVNYERGEEGDGNAGSI